MRPLDRNCQSSRMGRIALHIVNAAPRPQDWANISGRDMRPEEMSRRDSMKVAQYEVLGWRSQKATRPGRDDRRPLMFVKAHAGDQEPNVSIVPNGTDILFLASFPSASYWATFVESLWDESSSSARRSCVDAHQRPRGRDCISGRQPVLRLISLPPSKN